MTKRKSDHPYWLVRTAEDEWITWDGKVAAQDRVLDLRQSADDANEPKPWTEIVKMVPANPRADAVVRAAVKHVNGGPAEGNQTFNQLTRAVSRLQKEKKL